MGASASMVSSAAAAAATTEAANAAASSASNSMSNASAGSNKQPTQLQSDDSAMMVAQDSGAPPYLRTVGRHVDTLLSASAAADEKNADSADTDSITSGNASAYESHPLPGSAQHVSKRDERLKELFLKAGIEYVLPPRAASCVPCMPHALH